jgi:glucose dehydrogenase
MNERPLVSVALFVAGLLGTTSLFAQQVTFDRLLHGDREPHNWLSYSGTFANHRHSLLTQVTPANVKELELQWVWQARSLEKFEATPLVVDGVLYTVQAPNDVVALDAVTGRVFWTFPYQPAPEARPCEPGRSHPP